LCVLSASKFFSFSKVVLLVSFLLGSSSPFLLGGKNDNFDDVESGVSLHCPQETPATDSPIAGLISQPSITDGHSKPSITDGHSKPSITDLPYEVRLQSLNERPSLKERQRCCEEWSIQCSPEGLLGGTLSMSIEDVMDNIQHLRNMPESTKWNIEPYGEALQDSEERRFLFQSIEALDGKIVASMAISAYPDPYSRIILEQITDRSYLVGPVKFKDCDTLKGVLDQSGKRFHSEGDYRCWQAPARRAKAKNIFMDLCYGIYLGHGIRRGSLEIFMQYIAEQEEDYFVILVSTFQSNPYLKGDVASWPEEFRKHVRLALYPQGSDAETRCKGLFSKAVWGAVSFPLDVRESVNRVFR